MRRAALAIACCSLLAGPPATSDDAGPRVRLEDRSDRSGLEIVTHSGGAEKAHILESTGNGLVVLDYDGDGYRDLFVVTAHRLPPGGADEALSRLYRGRGDGSFEDVTARAGVAVRGFGQGGCVGDLEGDGDPDLYLTAFGRDTLLVNGGDGTFEDRTEASIPVPQHAWAIGCVWLDADADGDQDLYVARYIDATWEDVAKARRTRRWRGAVEVMDGPRGLPAAANSFYLNDGRGRLREATREAGLAEEIPGYSMDATALDVDHDGLVDLYVANDSTPNRLFRNLGAGRFEEIGAWSGSAFNGDGVAQGSMGVGIADFDGNGWMDLVVTNFAHDYTALYLNLGGGLFEDGSFETGLAVPTYLPLGWAALPLDVEHDGDPDLFLANGHIYPQVDEDPSLGESFRQPNQLLLNEGGQLLVAASPTAAGWGALESSRGGVTADLENDGDADVIVLHQGARPSVLVNETATGNSWLGASVRQGGWELHAPGTIGRVDAAGRVGVGQLIAGGSYASQSDHRLLFGLGRADRARSLDVAVGGRRWRFEALAAGRYYTLDAPGLR